MKGLMRIFCDENILVETEACLRSIGHDVSSIREVGLLSASDQEILAEAIRQDRVLLTYNADFSDIRLFPLGTHAGIIRLRVSEQTAECLHPLLERALRELAGRDISGKLVTLNRTGVRIRTE